MIEFSKVFARCESVYPFDAEGVEGIVIEWSGNIGFGQYTLYKDEQGFWRGDSEHMDSQKEKDFLRYLLNDFVEQIKLDR